MVRYSLKACPTGAIIRLFDRLFKVAEPDRAPKERKDDKTFDYKENLNPDSLQVVARAMLEPSLASAKAGDRFQFERLGYFSADRESAPAALVFNRTVTLKDTWAREQAKGGA